MRILLRRLDNVFKIQWNVSNINFIKRDMITKSTDLTKLKIALFGSGNWLEKDNRLINDTSEVF
jgi:hypothetical protein